MKNLINKNKYEKLQQQIKLNRTLIIGLLLWIIFHQIKLPTPAFIPSFTDNEIEQILLEEIPEEILNDY